MLRNRSLLNSKSIVLGRFFIRAIACRKIIRRRLNLCGFNHQVLDLMLNNGKSYPGTFLYIFNSCMSRARYCSDMNTLYEH